MGGRLSPGAADQVSKAGREVSLGRDAPGSPPIRTGKAEKGKQLSLCWGCRESILFSPLPLESPEVDFHS